MTSLGLRSPVWIAAVGALSAIAGLIALVLSLSRKKRPDLHLMSFGTTALLYGIRLLITTQIGQSGIEPPQGLLFAKATLTYLILVPLTGFITLLFGPGRGRSLLWSFRGAIVFAASGILSDAVQARPMSLGNLNNILVILWAAVVMANAILPGPKKPREMKIVLAGFLVFGMFALNENLADLGLPFWSGSEEWIGFFLFLASLGMASANRFFANEARLRDLERELEIARRIQSSILPGALPELSGLKTAARYVPMAAVAGDFYDILVQGETRLCVLVADVSGHGLGAALLASMLKIAFAAQEDVLASPGRVLAGMNRALRGKLEGNFVTASCVFFDLASGFARSAAAGHPPFLLSRMNEAGIRAVGENGLILGPFPDAEFPETITPFERGDRIVIYTDGITEARNLQGEFFGQAGLERFIGDRRPLPPKRFAEALLDHLRAWSGRGSEGPFDDDLTLVVIDRT